MRLEARGGGGPGLAGLNLEEEGRPLSPLGLCFLISTLGVMISATSEGCAMERLCSSLNSKRTCKGVSGACRSRLGRGRCRRKRRTMEEIYKPKSIGQLPSYLTLHHRLVQSAWKFVHMVKGAGGRSRSKTW